MPEKRRRTNPPKVRIRKNPKSFCPMKLFCRLLLSVISVGLFADTQAKHLFVLSGQSNMQGHRPEEAFTPMVEKALGKEKVIVVQDALGGQPIYRWWKEWKDPEGEKPNQSGDLYDRFGGQNGRFGG